MVENTKHIESRWGVPPDGRWYMIPKNSGLSSQNKMISDWNEQDRQGVTVSWDMGKAKLHGFYPDACTLRAALMKVKEGKRNGYELIPEWAHCCPFLDVEFLVDTPDPEHARLKMVCAHVKESIMATFGVVANIRVFESSRPDSKSGKYKHSYHIIVPNVIMDNNHNGEMDALMSFGVLADEAAQKESDFYFENITKEGKKEQKYIIDLSVYSKNRAMRMLWCSKAGSSVSFQRMLGTEFAPYFDITPAANDDDEFQTSLIVRVYGAVTPRLVQYTGTTKHQRQRKSMKARAEDIGEVPGEPSQKRIVECPVAKDKLLDLLRDYGDHKSKMEDCTLKDGLHSVYFKTQGKRVCLNPDHREHTGNNFCICLIETAHGRSFDALYKCFADGCNKRRPLLNLGRMENIMPIFDHSAEEDVVDDCPPEPAAVVGYFNPRPEHLFLTYSEPLVRDLPMEYHRVTAICAPCGTGKTKASNRFLERQRKYRRALLFIKIYHRTVLSKKGDNEAQIIDGKKGTHYTDDAKGEIFLDRGDIHTLSIQYESLGRINRESLIKCMRKNEIIVIVDEYNSVQRQTMSKFGNPFCAASTYHFLMQECQVLVMDGYLTQATLDILQKTVNRPDQQEDEPIYLIHNTFKSRSRHTVRVSRDKKKTLAWLFDQISKGKHGVTPCVHKETADEIAAAMTVRFVNTKKVVLITKENPWDKVDVNVTWTAADLVIHTSAIDCGVSHEKPDHFDFTLTMADNVEGPACDTVVQMLSRARCTTQHVLFCQAKSGSAQRRSTAFDVVLRENLRDVATREAVFHGTVRAFAKPEPTRWEDCSSVAAVTTWCMVMANKSLNDMAAAVVELLERDGAVVDWHSFDAEMLPEPNEEEGDGLIDMTGKELRTSTYFVRELIAKYEGSCDFVRQYGLKISACGTYFVCPEYDYAVTISAYSGRRMANVFRNCNILARNGVGMVDALMQIRRDTTRLSVALAMLDQHTGGRYSSAIDLARRVGCVTGSNYFLEANERAANICLLVLGAVDPFNLPPQTNVEICRRLECSTSRVETPSGAEAKRKPRTVQLLSPLMNKKLLDLYISWVNVDKNRHEQKRDSTSYCRSMSVGKALALLNHVLMVMYDMRYFRTGVEKVVNGVRTHEYALKQSSFFHRKGAPFDVLDKAQSKKPCIDMWLAQPLKDLSIGQLVELNLETEVIQTGAAYARRQGDTTARRSYRPLQLYDIGAVEEEEEADGREEIRKKRSRDAAEIATMGFNKRQRLDDCCSLLRNVAAR